jgi:hypothetical protein
LISSCSKPKTVLICGDHICVNKAEANQYFEDNLSIEVKIVDKKTKKKFDLVELNLKSNQGEKKKVSIIKKQQTQKDLKILSDKEIKEKKTQILLREKVDKKNLDILKKNKNNKSDKINNRIIENNITAQKAVNKTGKEIIDICAILEKCSIDEISKYLIEDGKGKKFPDITKRE